LLRCRNEYNAQDHGEFRDNVVFVAITDTEKLRSASTNRKPMRGAAS